MSARPAKRKTKTKSRARARRKPAQVKPTDAAPAPGPVRGEDPSPLAAKAARPLDERPWKERRVAVESMLDELQTHPSAQRVRAIAEQLALSSADPKWEVRHSVARALAYLEHPDYATIAARLDTDANSFVARAARASAAKRRELDLAYQAKSDEIDEVSLELHKLREAHGERVATAAERIAEHKFRLLTNETTHEMRTVVASLLDALTKLDASLEQSPTSKKVYERTLRIARERTSFLQLMLDDTKRLVDEPKLEREDVAVVELLDKVAEIVRDALDIPASVGFEVEAAIAPGTNIHVPRVRLIQALSSLAKNAIEAVEGEGHVTLEATSPRRGWVTLSVADDGYGMGPEDIRQALLPMVSSKKDDRHTGVGLPLAKKIIERECRGVFGIDSEPETGTTVTCLLPTTDD
ncbi:Cell-division control histidine kinase PdhS [Enhygromyxa salina]|uniref:histidine kinase n=1 Tax=Enhygromyxa salina TaxID=215803 RepID=A0A2S9Y8H3_9BACT|nr:HAMP domain-containing sensor histidine kinase [Enhygromyxa salina]PRQ01321.1 Cell-division control histidine kinase PdhS [Enhygromyxa salina]